MTKLESVPPFRLDETHRYKVKTSELEYVVTASSTFEAAAKFAFWVKENGLESTPTVTVVVDTQQPSGTELYVYDIRFMEGDNIPQVELNYVDKKLPSPHVSPELVRSDGTSENETQTGNYVNMNLETVELITKCLSQYFGFPSFRPLQRETIELTMSQKDVMTIN